MSPTKTRKMDGATNWGMTIVIGVFLGTLYGGSKEVSEFGCESRNDLTKPLNLVVLGCHCDNIGVRYLASDSHKSQAKVSRNA